MFHNLYKYNKHNLIYYLETPRHVDRAIVFIQKIRLIGSIELIMGGFHMIATSYISVRINHE